LTLTAHAARIALVAGLMLGVVAMHSFGHTAHGGQGGEIVVTGHGGHHGHANSEPAPTEDDPDLSPLLSAVGLMVCGAIIVRLAVECFRSAAWSRLWERLIADLERLGRAPSQRWLPPPRLRPTGLPVNRNAVLRI
jgi:hypothetical protein